MFAGREEMGWLSDSIGGGKPDRVDPTCETGAFYPKIRKNRGRGESDEDNRPATFSKWPF